MDKAFKLFLPIFVLVSIVAISSCRHDDTVTENELTWQSDNPFLIPFEVRMEQYNRGNMAVNGSFEEGRVFTEVDKQSFDIQYWNKSGDNLQWVKETNDSIAQLSVAHGRAAIHFVNNKRDEYKVEENSIISDFIRVLPGNYSLDFMLKVNYLHANKSRLGLPLGDAFSVKLRFYDKNKIEMFPRGYFSSRNIYIDDSDKLVHLSGLDKIENLPWVKVYARSANYPYFDGDIPEDVKYVRIQFSLKSYGDVLIDDVNFRFSKWNFTPYERLRAYFNTSLTPYDLLVPTPQKISNKKAYRYLHKNPDMSSGIALVGDYSILNSLSSQLKNFKQELISLQEDLPNGTVEVSILNKNKLNEHKNSVIIYLDNSAADSLANNQSYNITYVDSTNLKFTLQASGINGFVYGLQTLLQLFDKTDYIVHAAQIYDFPDYKERSFVFDDIACDDCVNNIVDNLNYYHKLRYNHVYKSYDSSIIETGYMMDFKYIDEIHEQSRQYGMHLGVMVNPYVSFGFHNFTAHIPDEQLNRFSHKTFTEKLLSDLYKFKQIGIEHLVLAFDDFIPNSDDYYYSYLLFSDTDRDEFLTLADAQSYVVNEVYNWKKYNYPNLYMEMIPSYYSNLQVNESAGHGELYYYSLSQEIPADVQMFWTGPTIRSLKIDQVDVLRLETSINRKPILWDNSLYARTIEAKDGGYISNYPGKIQLCGLFEPFDIDIAPGIESKFENSKVLFNGPSNSELFKIKLATAADYSWNSKAYDPEFSLWKVLVNSLGKENAIELIRFNDTYFKLVSYFRKIDCDPTTNREQTEIDYLKQNLELSFLRLKSDSSVNYRLKAELESLYDEIIRKCQNSEELAQ